MIPESGRSMADPSVWRDRDTPQQLGTAESIEHDERCRHDHDHEGNHDPHLYDHDNSLPDRHKSKSHAMAAERTIAPFLHKHIPEQQQASYSLHEQRPVGGGELASATPRDTKFCYRHAPDSKCRRQADEPSMEQLQEDLTQLSQEDQQAISHVWTLFSGAPGKHRNLMLKGILTQCCFPQLSFISANIRDLIKIDFVSTLPAELAFKILCYLDTTSLCKASQVSQRWRTLADDDVVWHKMCEQHIDRKCTKCGWGLPLLERKRLRIEKRQIQLRATGRGLNEWSPDITPIPEETLPEVPSVEREDSSEDTSTTTQPLCRKRSIESGPSAPSSPEMHKKQRTSSNTDMYKDSSLFPRKRPWKDVYKDRFKVGTAWKYGRCSTKIFKGHTNGVMCLQFDDNTLITGSYDSTVKVWDIQSGQCLRTLTGHTSGIRCLQFDDRKLMTGSLDSTLKLWDWKTGECLRTFPAHADGIITLHFTRRYVASGSRDKTIRVWDSDTKETFLLRGHGDWVNSVKIDEPSRTLFSASDDLTVRLWDLDSHECIRVFEGHVGQVQQVVPMPAEFELDDHRAAISGDKDDDASSVSSVIIAPSHSDQRGRSVERELAAPAFWPKKEGGSRCELHRPAPPRYMITGALDSTIRLWDTHFRPNDHADNALCSPPSSAVEGDGGDWSKILPTDPLTNSHTPRAAACVRTFFGHVEGIWALSADHLRLISGSEDRMMKVWDPRTGKCERTFTGHQGPVTCAWLSDSRVASGSEDCEVRMLCFGAG